MINSPDISLIKLYRKLLQYRKLYIRTGDLRNNFIQTVPVTSLLLLTSRIAFYRDNKILIQLIFK